MLKDAYGYAADIGDRTQNVFSTLSYHLVIYFVLLMQHQQLKFAIDVCSGSGCSCNGSPTNVDVIMQGESTEEWTETERIGRNGRREQPIQRIRYRRTSVALHSLLRAGVVHLAVVEHATGDVVAHGAATDVDESVGLRGAMAAASHQHAGLHLPRLGTCVVALKQGQR